MIDRYFTFLLGLSYFVFAGCATSNESAPRGSGSATSHLAAGDCGLSAPAFCETFDTAHPGGRGVDLDESRFGVARLTSNSNPYQGELEAWSPGGAIVCGAMTGGILPGNDFRVCNGQLNDSFDDGGAFAFHSTTIRQAFDFTGRTGSIVFDVDAKSVGHGWWTEIWISDEPVPGPYQSAPGVASFPHNGFGIQILGDGCPGGDQGLATAVHDVFVIQDHAMAHDYQGGDFQTQRCVSTQDQVLNHFELKVSQTKLELWGTDAGMPSSFRLVMSIDHLNLPLTRGYVNFQHTHYNAAKAGVSPSQTYRWDNLGFDGPVLPADRIYDVADSDTMNGSERNVGYELANDGTAILALSVEGVDLTGASSATLHFTVRNFVANALIRFRVNGGPWHDDPQHYADPTEGTRTESLPVPLNELRQGSNAIELVGTNDYLPFVIANADIAVE